MKSMTCSDRPETVNNFYISKSSQFNKKKETPANTALSAALQSLRNDPKQWVVEVLDSNDSYIHPYFDIDIKNRDDQDKDEVIEQMLKFDQILDCFIINGYDVNYYQEGTDAYPYYPEYPYLQIPEEVKLANSEDVTIKNKYYSAHVYISGRLVNRNEFNSQMHRIFGNSEIIDYHIYSAGHKIFRHPYSPKPCDNKGLRINASIEQLTKIFGDGLNFTIHTNESRKYEMIESLEFLDAIEPLEHIKTIRAVTKEQEKPTIKSASIFLKLRETPEAVTLNDLLTEDDKITSYELSQQLLPYINSPLTHEEFVHELEALPYYVKHPLDIERLLSQRNISNYTQTYNIKPLRILKSKWSSWMKASKLSAEMVTIMESVLNRIDYYIAKYEQLCFANAKSTYDGKRKSPLEIYDQVCRIDGKLYIKGYNGKLMQSSNDAVMGMFNTSDYKVRDFKRTATFYSSVSEYERLRVQIEYEQNKTKYDRDAQVMLKIARLTFSSNDEFLLYFSFIAAKLRKERKQQRLNIVNYGKKDCLKTTLTVIFSDYMKYSTCKITDINMNFNAALSSDLVNIEELPADITRRNETFAVLKDVLANPKIEITKKGYDSETLDNYLNVIISTNERNCCGLFNRNDWEPMSKRFRVIQREQLNEERLTEFFSSYSDASVFALVEYIKKCEEFQHFEKCRYFKEITPIQQDIINEEKSNDDINPIRNPELLSEFLVFERKSKIRFIIKPFARLLDLSIAELKNKLATTEYINYNKSSTTYTIQLSRFSSFIKEWCVFSDDIEKPERYVGKYDAFYNGDDSIPSEALN